MKITIKNLGHNNIVDMVAIDSTLSAVVHGQQIANVQDTPLTQGTFGLVVSAGKNNISEVVYREAEDLDIAIKG